MKRATAEQPHVDYRQLAMLEAWHYEFERTGDPAQADEFAAAEGAAYDLKQQFKYDARGHANAIP